jgi:cation diffusion facilitator family transporter
MNREKKIIQTSIIGIIANVFLVVIKIFIGVLAHSVSIISDGINNLTDSLSSVITIIGTKLAGKKPDKKHPYGHGRIEYLIGLVIGLIILVAGVMAIYESAKALVEKPVVEYNIVSLIIIALAVLVKVFIGLYSLKVGKAVNSEPLKASGKDALFDVLLSTATVIGIITSLLWGVNIEGYIGIIIGIFILRAAVEVLHDGSSLIIGERASAEVIENIKSLVSSFSEVKGTYDLIINSYGEERKIASVHIEVDDNLTATDIHHLTRSIASKVYSETGTILTVGIYASNEKNPEIKKIKDYIYELVNEDKGITQIHGFYIDEDKKLITFDLIFDFNYNNPNMKILELNKILKEKYPEYSFYIIQDTDFSG